MILVDTNALLRYFLPSDPLHLTIRAAVGTLLTVPEELVIVSQSVYEFWVVATRPVRNNGFGLTTVAVQQLITEVEAEFRVLADPSDLYDRWKALVVAHDCKGKVAHDARLVAAMQAHGVARLLTFNGPDFARYSGVTVLDPATAAAVP